MTGRFPARFSAMMYRILRKDGKWVRKRPDEGCGRRLLHWLQRDVPPESGSHWHTIRTILQRLLFTICAEVQGSGDYRPCVRYRIRSSDLYCVLKSSRSWNILRRLGFFMGRTVPTCLKNIQGTGSVTGSFLFYRSRSIRRLLPIWQKQHRFWLQQEIICLHRENVC